MKATKFMKGLLAAALAVTIAVTPSVSAAAAGATVTSGSSTYIFEEMPVAAFEVTGLGVDPYAYKEYDPVALTPGANTFILWCIPYDSTVYSAPGSSAWVANVYGTEYAYADNGQEYKYFEMYTPYTDSYATNEYNQLEYSRGVVYQDSLDFAELFHVGAPQKDAIYVLDLWEEDDLSWIPALFGQMGATAVPISVADALAKSNGVSVDAAAAQAAAEAAQAAAQTQVTQPQTTTTPGTYVVEPNDNLSKIAQEVYGDRKAWRDIYNANSDVIKSDYIIYKGQVLTIPARTVQNPTTQQQVTVPGGTYVVEANDSLASIAQKVYGDSNAWRDIYNANSGLIKNNYIIYKGQVLTIPTR